MRAELTGNNRERLLAIVVNSKLANAVNQLYRPNAYTGDGGTADMLICAFFEGHSGHLQKANDMLNHLHDIVLTEKLNLNEYDVIEALIWDLENAIELFN